MSQNHSFIQITKNIFYISLFLFSCKKDNYAKSIDGTWIIMNMKEDSIKNDKEIYLTFFPKHNKVSIILEKEFIGDYKFQKNNILTIYNSKKEEYNNSYILKIDTIINDFEFYRFRLSLLSNKKDIIADRIALKYFGNP